MNAELDLLPRQIWRELHWAGPRERLALAGPEELRRVARAAAALAIARVFDEAELVGTGLDATAEALRRGGGGRAEARHAEICASEFDELAFDIRDAAEQDGDLTGGIAYTFAFAKARAASAVRAALSEDPVAAARDALYEARHAIADDASLLELLDDQLKAR